MHYRRSPSIVSYWSAEGLRLENYEKRTIVDASPIVIDLLDRCAAWITFDAVAAAMRRVPADLLRELIDALVEHGLLDAADAPPAPRTSATSAATAGPAGPAGATIPTALATGAIATAPAWAAWGPAARYFHCSTRDVPFTEREETNQLLERRARLDPPPAAIKPPIGDPRALVTLPAPSLAGDLPDVLLARRTWRRFGRRALTLAELGTLLGLTWRVQEWIDVTAWGRMALKTAPSGGARHSIEAYIVARHVRGLKPGLYHYQPAAHALDLVRPKVTAADIAAYLPRQAWYGAASAVVLMTCVFPRVQWRYPFARAYRTVLAEAGHHCQNFCLVATQLGLAPFCTMALADTRIEQDLRIDGVTESVLYAAGVGPRPAGVAWAPWPDTARTPRRTVNVRPPAKTRTRAGKNAR